MADVYSLRLALSALFVLLLVPASADAASGAPSAEELIHQAESLYTGSAGVVDDARAHDLFERAAATGDPRAILRVATLQQFGKAGFDRDPARAAALARPVVEEVRRLAERGDAKAQYLMGTVHALGIGQPPDQRAGVAWYESSARGGEILAMHNLGWMYDTGSGVEKDPEKAFSWYLRAAEGGYAASMYEVARSLIRGSGVAADPAAGAKWLREAAERRHPLAMAVLGGELLAGEHLAQDLEEGARWMKAAADAGEVQGQYGLARAYLFGLGVPRDGARARSLFQEAAARGNSGAEAYVDWLDRLGPASEEGARDQADLMAKAIVEGHDWAHETLAHWLQKRLLVAEQIERVRSRLSRAAESGNPTAQASFGALLYEGLLGADRDVERALDLFRQATAKGSPSAMRMLGHAYNNGIGVSRDRQEALAWWRRAAEAGDSHAALWLGSAYINGNGVERDPKRALELIGKAGEAGNYPAMRYLAKLYESGAPGVPKDAARARHWYERLAAMGDEEAQGWLRFQELAGSE